MFRASLYPSSPEDGQQDATNLMFIIKLLSQHVSGIIYPSSPEDGHSDARNMLR